MVLGGPGPKPFVYTSPTEIRLLSKRRKRWVFNNRGAILTLIIHWLGPPLFLPWCAEATLVSWSEGLAEAHTRKHLVGSEAIYRMTDLSRYPTAI